MQVNLFFNHVNISLIFHIWHIFLLSSTSTAIINSGIEDKVMEPVTYTQQRKRSTDTKTNFCFICQKQSNAPTRKLESKGLEWVQQALSELKKYHDYAKWDVVERLDAVSFQSFFWWHWICLSQRLLWHFHKCYASQKTENKVWDKGQCRSGGCFDQRRRPNL